MLRDNLIKYIGITLVLSSIILVGCGRNNSNVENDSSVVSAVSQQETDAQFQDSNNVRTADSSELVNSDSDNADTDGGGNENNSSSVEKIAEFNILISEDKYFYNNSPIEIDDFISIISEYDGEKIVVISDDNATLQAYKSLTEKLDSLEVSYEDAK